MSDPLLPPPVPQAPPSGYGGYGQSAPPTYAPPAGAYAASPYGFTQPQGGYLPPAPPAKRSGTVGVIALLLALTALLVSSIMGGIAGWEIGMRLAETDPAFLENADSGDLSFLTPVRDQVLWAEIAFWIGTALGLWALVQGIIAIASRRGRGAGIGAVVVAVLAPVVYFGVVMAALAIGAATGAMAIYGGI